MTHEQAKEVMRDLAIRARLAHYDKNYTLRNELCDLHDKLALAVWHESEIPTLPDGAPSGCLFRKLAA